MGKGTWGILLVGAVGLAYLVRKKVHTAEKLKFLPQGVKITGKFPNYKVFFLLDITNPTDEPLNVDNIFADISVSGSVLGKVQRTKPFQIKPSRTTAVSLPVIISTGNIPALIKIVAGIIKGTKNIVTKVTGMINAEGVETEINQTYKLSK